MMARQSATSKIAIMDKRYVARALAVAIRQQDVKYAKHATLCLRENVRLFALKARPGGTPSPDTPAARLEEPKLRQQTA